MQHTQDANRSAGNLIGGNIRRVPKDQFSCAFDASGTAHLRKLDQPLDLLLNPVIHANCGLRTVCLVEVEDRIAVVERKDGPLDPHGLTCFTACRGPALGKVGLHGCMRDCGLRVLKRLPHLRPEPGVVLG